MIREKAFSHLSGGVVVQRADDGGEKGGLMGAKARCGTAAVKLVGVSVGREGHTGAVFNVAVADGAVKPAGKPTGNAGHSSGLEYSLSVFQRFGRKAGVKPLKIHVFALTALKMGYII